eukprot:TRINITY_DN22140_c0_g1_i1.p1 TRINITY_DN22140_c0_g1~~TRINITY_DN22140_c0_g1_i1.p1  ORF type:complete len:610 (+),score=216.01 TRINITY_DN22140_c0_g1_i1:86-1915(+)
MSVEVQVPGKVAPMEVVHVRGGAVAGAEKLAAYTWQLQREMNNANLERLWERPKYLEKVFTTVFDKKSFLAILSDDRKRTAALSRFLKDHATRQKVLADILAANPEVLAWRGPDPGRTPAVLVFMRRLEGLGIMEGLCRRNRKLLDAFTGPLINEVSSKNDSLLYVMACESGRAILELLVARHPDLDIEYATLTHVMTKNLEMGSREDRDATMRFSHACIGAEQQGHPQAALFETVLDMARKTAERRGDADPAAPLHSFFRRAMGRPPSYWMEGSVERETPLYGWAHSDRGAACMQKIVAPLIRAQPTEEELAARPVRECHVDPFVVVNELDEGDDWLPARNEEQRPAKEPKDYDRQLYGYALMKPPRKVHADDEVDLGVLTDILPRHREFRSTIPDQFSCALIEFARHETGLAFLNELVAARPSVVRLWGRQLAYGCVADSLEPRKVERDALRDLRSCIYTEQKKAAEEYKETLDAAKALEAKKDKVSKKELKRLQKLLGRLPKPTEPEDVWYLSSRLDWDGGPGAVQNAKELFPSDFDERLNHFEIGRDVLAAMHAALAEFEAAGYPPRREPAPAPTDADILAMNSGLRKLVDEAAIREAAKGSAAA